MKYKHNILRIALYAFAFIIVTELIILLLMKSGNSSIMDNAKIIGTISKTDSRVYVNNISVPAYGYDNKVYIAAEDLIPFGAELTNVDGKNSDLNINTDTVVKVDTSALSFSQISPGEDLAHPAYSVFVNDKKAKDNFYCRGYNIIPIESLNVSFDSIKNRYDCTLKGSNKNTIIKGSERAQAFIETSYVKSSFVKKVIVLDPGHGKSSAIMSDDEKKSFGWIYNSSKKQWGEWRHWKSGSMAVDCEGIGCNGRVTPNNSCWYPIADGDRNIEPDINLNNCLSAKKYLEDMGYEVRLTRSSNEENPSITKRLSYCYPNNDQNSTPNAEVFVCVHSNAGGGSGSAYINLGGSYDQKNVSENYVESGNNLGKTINDEIVKSTSLKMHNSGKISGMEAVIAFCKSPITTAYLEIGFFDNANDLSILKTETDAIGKAIATGIDKYLKLN